MLEDLFDMILDMGAELLAALAVLTIGALVYLALTHGAMIDSALHATIHGISVYLNEPPIDECKIDAHSTACAIQRANGH